jgi:hypothetical protein
VALGAALVMISACGGGSSKDKTPSATGSASSGGSGGDGNTDELKAAAAKFAASTYKATYTVSGTGSDAFANGKLVITKDGDKKFRFDADSTQDSETVSIIFIETDTASVSCLKNAGDLGAVLGVAADQGVCFNNDPSGDANPLGGLSDSLKDLENANVTVLEKSSRQVAGHDTTCYRTRDNSTGDTSTSCFDGDGVMLYVENEGAEASTIEATDVTKSVSGDDFNVPYEVKDLPSLGG